MIDFATVARRCNIDSTGNNGSGKPMKFNRTRCLQAVGALICLGLASCHRIQSHSVTLTWQAPPAVPGITIVAYNIYRKTADGGKFVRIASRVSGPPYEDRLIMNDRTYVYAVSALDQAGRESRFSVEARATIP